MNNLTNKSTIQDWSGIYPLSKDQQDLFGTSHMFAVFSRKKTKNTCQQKIDVVLNNVVTV